MKTIHGARLAVAASVFLSACPALADKVGLKNGNVFNGRIVPGAPEPLTFIDKDGGAPTPAPVAEKEEAEGEAGPAGGGADGKIPDFVTIRLDMGGQMTIPAADIAWIEDVEDPPEEFAADKPKDAGKGKPAAAKKPAAKKPPPPKKPSPPKPPAKPRSG